MENPTFDHFDTTDPISRPNVHRTICLYINTNYKQYQPVPQTLPNSISINCPICYAHDYYPILKSVSTQSHHHLGDHQADQLKSPPNDEVVISSSGGHRLTRLISYCKRHYCPDQASFQSSSRAFCGFIQSLFPILHWLPNYDLRENLLRDLVTGVTILALNIPQGLAYGRLAGVEPIYGLYVSLFPVIIYSLMGTSRQISIGTFAVVSMACRDVLNNFKIPLDGTVTAGMDSNGTVYLETEMLQFGGQKLRPIDVLTSLALLIGLFQLLVGSFRLGFLAILLSDPVVSSFVVASSMHVFSSQVFALISIDSTPRNTDLSIPFEFVNLWDRLFKRLLTANPATIIISILTLSVLLLCKNLLEPFLQRKYRLRSIALPIDIVCIIVLTGLSYAFELNKSFKVESIPRISAGFENIPTVPRLDLWPQLFTSALLLAFVIYVSTYSLEKMFALNMVTKWMRIRSCWQWVLPTLCPPSLCVIRVRVHCRVRLCRIKWAARLSWHHYYRLS